MPNTIIVETHGAVGLIRLNRPQALNALNAELMVELDAALEEIVATRAREGAAFDVAVAPTGDAVALRHALADARPAAGRGLAVYSRLAPAAGTAWLHRPMPADADAVAHDLFAVGNVTMMNLWPL